MDVEVGDVGTVVELLPPDGVEVEFLDRDGRTRCVATLGIADVLVLNRERTIFRTGDGLPFHLYQHQVESLQQAREG